MSKLGRRDEEKLARIEALYAELPTVQCRGLCSRACSAIPLTTLEARRLSVVSHVAPRTTPDRVCVYLQAGRCTVYQCRPLICRAWGVLRVMSCMHGCAPDEWLTDQKFLRIAQEIERLGGALVVTGPAGLELKNDTFLRIQQRISDDEVEAHAERVRGLRALHGGFIIGAHRGGPGGWHNIDGDDS